VRVERPLDDGGGAAGFCRTLLVCGDQAGLAPELLLGKFAKGGENIPDWEPVFTPSAAFPYGRHMHPFTLVSVAAGTGETGLQGGVPAPVPDLFLALPSDLNLGIDATVSELEVYRERVWTMLDGIVRGSAAGWGNAEGLAHSAPSDLVVDAHENPSDREPNWRVRSAVHEAVAALPTFKAGVLDMGESLTEAGDPLDLLDGSDLHRRPIAFWYWLYHLMFDVLLPRGAGTSAMPLPALPAKPGNLEPEFSNVTYSPAPLTEGDTLTVEADVVDPDGTITAQHWLFADLDPTTGPTLLSGNRY